MTSDAGSALEPVVLIGAGRAGRSLAAALRVAGVSHVLADRTTIVEQHGPPVFATREEALAHAAVVLLTVRDGQLDVALDALRDAPLRYEVVVLQVSGSAEPAARARIEAAGAHYGTFHPLLPLVDPSLASFRLLGSVVGIEGDAAAMACASRLAARLGASTIVIPRAQRAAYHAAAVLASNFPVTLAALAEGLLARIGVDEAAAHRAVRTLMAASVDNLAAAPRALDALTGPIARGDVTTVRAHATALHGAPPWRDAYEALSQATLALLRARGDDPAGLAALAAALEADGAR